MISESNSLSRFSHQSIYLSDLRLPPHLGLDHPNVTFIGRSRPAWTASSTISSAPASMSDRLLLVARVPNIMSILGSASVVNLLNAQTTSLDKAALSPSSSSSSNRLPVGKTCLVAEDSDRAIFRCLIVHLTLVNASLIADYPSARTAGDGNMLVARASRKYKTMSCRLALDRFCWSAWT